MKKQPQRLVIPLFFLLMMIFLTGCNTDDAAEPAEVSGGDTESVETEEETVSDEEEPAEEMEKEDDHEMTEEETVENTENVDQTEENVVTEDVASPLLAQGETAVFTFQEEGVYNIHCDPHPVMKMTVTVEQGAEIEGSIELDIEDYEFSEDITVAPGTVITWTNKDSARHNVAIEIGE